MRTWWRKPTRAQVALHSRKARKAESYIVAAGGLREWFVCCAWRGNQTLGMPSRAVDEAWHEFILATPSYTGFCRAAYGHYLHHTPDEVLSTPMPETVRAWDRSDPRSEKGPAMCTRAGG